MIKMDTIWWNLLGSLLCLGKKTRNYVDCEHNSKTNIWFVNNDCKNNDLGNVDLISSRIVKRIWKLNRWICAIEINGIKKWYIISAHYWKMRGANARRRIIFWETDLYWEWEQLIITWWVYNNTSQVLRKLLPLASYQHNCAVMQDSRS